MKRKLLDLSGKIEALETEVLKSISRSADILSVDYFIVGATARDLVFGVYDIDTGRATKDLDIGIQVETWDHFFQLKTSLLDTGDYAETDQLQRLEFQQSFKVDIVPFGQIAGEDELIEWPPDKSTVMKTTGFKDAFNDAFSGGLRDDPDFKVNIASIPGLAIMKMIAWDDNYPNRNKDAIDLEFIMRNYIDAGNTERFYEEGSDILKEKDFDYEAASSRFLGRDAAKISSAQTKRVLEKILTEQTGDQDRYRLVEDMISGHRHSGDKFEIILNLVESFRTGYCDLSTP